jgi:hypothetical protein
MGMEAKLTAWLLLTGLFTTIPALLLLPAGNNHTDAASPNSAIPNPQLP